MYQRHDDLTPVRLSARNAYVVLDDVTVSALSPIRHLDRLHAPVIVAYGACETPEFQRQNREFAAAVENAGKKVQLLVAEHYNHFELPETLGGSAVFEAANALLAKIRAAAGARLGCADDPPHTVGQLGGAERPNVLLLPAPVAGGGRGCMLSLFVVWDMLRPLPSASQRASARLARAFP